MRHILAVTGIVLAIWTAVSIPLAVAVGTFIGGAARIADARDPRARTLTLVKS